MSVIKDRTLGDFSNLAYVELNSDLEEKVRNGVGVTLKELADSCIDKYSNEESYQKEDILNVLRKCQSGEYKDYKIVDYDNDNGKTGFVGYAIETNTGELIIT